MASIQKRKNKSGNVYRVKYWDGRRDINGNRLYEYSQWLGKRKEAEEYRQSLNQMKTAQQIDIQSVNQAIDYMLDTCGTLGRDGKTVVQSSTVSHYTYITSKAKSYNWPKSISELSHTDGKDFRAWLLKKYSRDMARRVLSTVSSAISEAAGHNNNPLVGISITREEKEEVLIPSKAEVSAILQAAERLKNSKDAIKAKAWEKYYPIIILLYASGMRRQELLAFPDFGLFKEHVKVLQALKKTGLIGKPKSKKGLRTIPIDKSFLEPTRWYLENRWIDSEQRLIFPNAQGRVQSPDNFRNRCWIPLMKEAGLCEEVKLKNGNILLSPKFTPHHLRHYFASIQISHDRGNTRLSAKRIQELLGHASITMTYDIYGHLLQDEDEETDTTIRNAMII